MDYEDKEESGGVVLAGLVLCIPTGMLEAFSVYKIWNWFAPPYFNAPSVTYIQSLALVVLFGAGLALSKSTKSITDSKITGENVFMGLMKPIAILCFAGMFKFLISFFTYLNT